MKTKKFLSLAAVALLMTACSNVDELDVKQPVTPATSNNEITITATLDAKSGETNRALSVGGASIVSSWAVDEEIAVLFEVNSVKTKRVAKVTSVAAGTATIEFTIPAETAENAACTLVYPASAANTANTGVNTYANLLATQDGTLNANLDVRVGAGTIQVTTPGLTVSTQPAAQFAIFKFTLGSAIDATHPLTIKDNSDNVITTITPTASTTTVYAALAPASDKYYKFSATTAENKIISKSGSVTITKGNYYTQSLGCPVLGDLYYSDGTYSSTLQAGKTAIGVIAYLGTDNFTENGTNVGGSTFVGHGLVLCLKNAASGADAKWSTETSTLEFGEDAKVASLDALKRATNVSGYTNTKTLAEKDDAATKYKAAYAAKNYTGLTAPAGTTGWFLPSAQQWVKMQTGLGELGESSITWGSWFDTTHTAADRWENALSKAGAAGTAYDSMTSTNLYYWSSSEFSDNYAVYLFVRAAGSGDGYGFDWLAYYKTSTYDSNRVRPVLAF